MGERRTTIIDIRERETDGRIVSGKRERKDIEEKDKWGRD